MTPRGWRAGTVLTKKLADGQYHYAQLLAFPWARVFDLATEQPSTDPVAVAASPVLFTITAHRTLATQWAAVGPAPADVALPDQYLHDDDEPDDWSIIDPAGNLRPATEQECAGLEPAMVYEPEHIAQRLLDPQIHTRW